MLNTIYKLTEERNSKEVILVSGSCNFEATLIDQYIDRYDNIDMLEFKHENKRLILEHDEIYTYHTMTDGLYIILI